MRCECRCSSTGSSQRADKKPVAAPLAPILEFTNPMSRICLLIPTHKRNIALLRIVNQCQELIRQYQGHNSYEVSVTDSDPANSIAPALTAINYSINPGTGFDDNLYYFWRNNVDRYDFVFTISDDDLFMPGLNALYLIDAAAASGENVVMFNHRDYTRQATGSIQLGALFYADLGAMLNRTSLLNSLLTLLPRHISTLYSTSWLKANLDSMAAFRGTLHLYAAPIVFAAVNRTLMFVDYALCMYDTSEKADGAWALGADVLNGLAQFLKVLKSVLPLESYMVAERGFFGNYLGRDCWLRKSIKPSLQTQSEEEIRALLATVG
jgi:hypothetical protein